MSDLRVVVVTYSPGDALPTFLDTLAAATSADYDVVLADNGSTDGSVEVAAKRPNVRLLATGSNLGYGRAANLGATDGVANESWLVVANPDVIWEPGSLDTLLAAGKRWPRAGALGPAILTPQGDLYPSARSFPSLGRGVGHALCGWWWPSNPWTKAYRRERGTPAEDATGWLSGSCMLLRRKAFEEVGGFDDGYFMYFEDLDLCRRLRATGWASVYVPDAVVTHTGAHATSRAPEVMLRAHHDSAYRYLAADYPGRRWFLLRAALRVGLTARYWLSRLVRGMGEGARPTRRADVLARKGTDT